MRVGLATAGHLPGTSEDDQLLLAELTRSGIAATPVIWDDDKVEWRDFDMVVIRSIWDYHLKYARFLRWLDQLDSAGTRVCNSTTLARWNSDKRYMLELQERGVRVTPTILVQQRDAKTLAAILAETGWQQAVIKPAISSSGHETWFMNAPATATDELRFAEQVARMDVLVQEFAPGVQAGELSFVFLGGDYSHTVLKRPGGSEFRVQTEHGGTVEAVLPPNQQIEWARSVIATVPEPFSYARVDAVAAGDGLMLMELELLEPELFFKYDADAAPRLIAALGLKDMHAR